MHMYHKADMVINTINEMILLGHYKIITTKLIKVYNDIPKSDRSATNFIWYNLKALEEKGLIRLLKRTPVKKYELPTNPIELEEVV